MNSADGLPAFDRERSRSLPKKERSRETLLRAGALAYGLALGSFWMNEYSESARWAFFLVSFVG